MRKRINKLPWLRALERIKSWIRNLQEKDHDQFDNPFLIY